MFPRPKQFGWEKVMKKITAAHPPPSPQMRLITTNINSQCLPGSVVVPSLLFKKSVKLAKASEPDSF